MRPNALTGWLRPTVSSTGVRASSPHRARMAALFLGSPNRLASTPLGMATIRSPGTPRARRESATLGVMATTLSDPITACRMAWSLLGSRRRPKPDAAWQWMSSPWALSTRGTLPLSPAAAAPSG